LALGCLSLARAQGLLPAGLLLLYLAITAGYRRGPGVAALAHARGC